MTSQEHKDLSRSYSCYTSLLTTNDETGTNYLNPSGALIFFIFLFVAAQPGGGQRFEGLTAQAV